MTEFESAVPALGQALSQRGYTVLTPVQEAVLAPELKDADILVSAQTGSGKTVAFGLTLAPTLLDGAERFTSASAPLALVVAPTRELALQVRRELTWLYASTGASITSCVGGMDFRDERRALQRGAHIVVGTPGRLRDHIERNSLDTSAFKAIVLDEADEMLDLGFREDLEFILGSAPAERRTLMFSATVPRTIASLAKRYQRDAVRVSTSAEREQHIDIEYRALSVTPTDREIAIINVLRFYEAKNALVFCSTRAAVNRMTSRFTNRGFSVVALSGELSQNERTHALQAMRDGRARVCIATDVAARGIDLPNLELVIHAEMPRNRETLLHRSGRTGRAGRKGTCVLIVPHNERRRTERLLTSANINAEWARPPSIADITMRDHERILEDPALIEPASESELPFARELVSRHSPEQIAAAFLRLYRTGRSAPEELRDNEPADSFESAPRGRREPRRESRGEPRRDSRSEPRRESKNQPRRDDFQDGVWFSLSVGSKHTAEARWLLPMLCKAGGLSKNDIGAIRVRTEETHVELAPSCVTQFLETVGPDRVLERTVRVTQMDGPPADARPGAAASPPPAAKKPYNADRKPRDAEASHTQASPEKAESAPPQVKPAAREPYSKPTVAREPYRTPKDAGNSRPARNDDGPGKPRAKAPYKKPKSDEPFRKPQGDQPYRKSKGAGPARDQNGPKPKGKKPQPTRFSGKITAKNHLNAGSSGPGKGATDKPGSAPMRRRKVTKTFGPKS